MHGCRRKGRQAYGDILGTIGIWGAIARPNACRNDNGLAGGNLLYTVFTFHHQDPMQHQGNFREFRTLARLFPPRWAGHASNADFSGVGIYPADELLDPFGKIPGCLDNGRFVDQLRHKRYSLLLASIIPFSKIISPLPRYNL